MLNVLKLIFCLAAFLQHIAFIETLKVVEFLAGDEVSVGSEAKFILQTKAYPQPSGIYAGKKSIVHLGNFPSSGYRFNFHEFLLGSKDHVKICSSTRCVINSGDEMVHREDSAFVEFQESNITVSIVGSQQPESLHTGFRAFVERFDLNEKKDKCNQKIVLSDDLPTFFIKSPNYPRHMKEPLFQCIYNFSTAEQQGIRVKFFDFHTTDVNFNVAGKNTDWKRENQTFVGYLTKIQSFAKYYSDSAIISYSTPSTLDWDNFNRFFLIVDRYFVEEKVRQTSIVNPNGGIIGSNLNGQAVYPPNANFTWQSRDVPHGFRIAMLIELETEAGCDYLKISGIRNNSALDDWQFQGQYDKMILFAESPSVNLSFISDVTGQAKGFTALFYQQDCSCGKSSHPLTDNSSSLLLNSPGFESSKLGAYCPNLDCKWNIAFDSQKYYLEISFLDVQLRSICNEKSGKKNVVSIFNEIGSQIAELDYRNNSKHISTVKLSSGVANIAFSSDSAIFYDEEKKARGFAMEAKLKSYPTTPSSTQEIYLNASHSFTFVEFSNEEQECFAIYNIYSASKKPIKLFILEHSDALVDVFDGLSPKANLLYSNSVLQNKKGWQSSVESTSSFLRTRIYFTQKRKKFVAMAVTGETPLCPGSEVYSMDMRSSLEIAPANKKLNCSTIIYFPLAKADNFNALELDIPLKKGVKLYKGLGGNVPDNLVLLARTSPYPNYVYAKFIRLEMQETKEKQIIKVKATVRDSIQTIKKSQAPLGFLISPDYPHEKDSLSAKEALICHLDTESSTPTPIEIDLDSSINKSQVMIRLKRSLEEDEYDIVYLNDAFQGVFCGVALDVVYNAAKDEHGSGIFGTYNMDKDEQCGLGGSRESNSASWMILQRNNCFLLAFIVCIVYIF